MRHLKANTSVKVVIGPFVDNSDGYTPETGITLGAADEAELMKHDAAAVTDISGRTWAAIANMDGYYNLTLTTGDTDTEGMIVIAIQDDSVCLPVRMEFMVMSEASYDSMYAPKDTGYMDVNIKAVSEDTAAADNLEAIMDGTGAKMTLTQLRINAVSEAGGAVDIDNSDGPAIDARAGGASGIGLFVQGSGTGHGAHFKGQGGGAHGMWAQALSTGAGFKAQSASTNGFDASGGLDGIRATGGQAGSAGGHGMALYGADGAIATDPGGDGLHVEGGDGNTNGDAGSGLRGLAGAPNGTGDIGAGIDAVGNSSTCPGIRAVGGATSHGILMQGGSTSGDGLRGEGGAIGAGVGASFLGTGSNAGLFAKGGTTYPGISAEGGVSGGEGIKAVGSANNAGIYAEGGNGASGAHGIEAVGNGSGATDGDGIRATGGTNGGNGINAQSGAGATGNGINAKSNATSGAGLYAQGGATGPGMSLTGNGGAADIDADEIGTPVTLGDGASLAAMLTAIAGKTANAGSYDRTTDSNEAIADALSGVGLTQQQVRDAMKLAPTAGVPAAGSVDQHLDDIETDTGTTLPGLIGAPVVDLATDLANVPTNLLAATVDGVTLDVVYQDMLAMFNGKFDINTPVAGQTTFYKRDDATPLSVVSTAPTGRSRVSP